MSCAATFRESPWLRRPILAFSIFSSSKDTFLRKKSWGNCAELSFFTSAGFSSAGFSSAGLAGGRISWAMGARITRLLAWASPFIRRRQLSCSSLMASMLPWTSGPVLVLSLSVISISRNSRLPRMGERLAFLKSIWAPGISASALWSLCSATLVVTMPPTTSTATATRIPINNFFMAQTFC